MLCGVEGDHAAGVAVLACMAWRHVMLSLPKKSAGGSKELSPLGAQGEASLRKQYGGEQT